uniref:J domain-containing protein n=1 Tax=Glossina pallidipes TaxID=7398 RepID=A0A1B0A789_GLOPL
MFPKQLSEVNYYEILGVGINAAEPEIRQAYRRKSLMYHPDKNPGNSKARELFHHVTKAMEILTDTHAREAFDETIRSNESRWKQVEKWQADLEQHERDEQILDEMYEGLKHMVHDLLNDDDE